MGREAIERAEESREVSMRTRPFSIAAAVIGVALLVSAGAMARSQATTVRITTAMSAGEEVPAPTGSVGAARGTFAATVTKSDTGAVVAWQLTFEGLSGSAGAAHIHVAPRGQPGPVAVPLCGPCQSPASGSANVDASVLAAIQAGGAYVNVHTAANPPGEIRGQLGVAATVATALTSRQEVPKPKGNVRRAGGSFTATVTKSGTTGTIAWRLSFSRLTGRAVAAHIHIGSRGRSGPVSVPLCGPCRSGVGRTVNLNAAALSALESGRAYVNVHTARNPAGEIRGQINAVPLSLS
jgi:CHRD domain